MNNLHIFTSPPVESKFLKYPEDVRARIHNLRRLILETAAEVGLTDIEETLKWGEPSYLAKRGSTIRIDWKAKTPGQYAMYFKCTSKLVPAFKAAFGDIFTYEGSRAIVFRLDDEIPEFELKQCIAAALTYHKVKHLQGLGIKPANPGS